MKIKAEYTNVDLLISSMKVITIKNKKNLKLLGPLEPLPQLIVTRWPGWLNAALYYSSNYTKLKIIVNSLEDDGMLMERAKYSVNNTNVFTELLCISKNHKPLIDIMDLLESNPLNIEQGYENIGDINLNEDQKNIEKYTLAEF